MNCSSRKIATAPSGCTLPCGHPTIAARSRLYERRHLPLLVISTTHSFYLSSRPSVSAWRDLMNAPLGASGKPQRFFASEAASRVLDYARNDRVSGEREAMGLAPQSLNRPRLGRHRPTECRRPGCRHCRQCLAGCSRCPRCHRYRCW